MNINLAKSAELTRELKLATIIRKSFLLAFICFLIYGFSHIDHEKIDLYYPNDIRFEDLSFKSSEENVEIYYCIDKLRIINSYENLSKQFSDADTKIYPSKYLYLVSFEDSEGKTVYATLDFRSYISGGDRLEMRERLESGVNSEGYKNGNLVISGCFDINAYELDSIEAVYDIFNTTAPGSCISYPIEYWYEDIGYMYLINYLDVIFSVPCIVAIFVFLFFYIKDIIKYLSLTQRLIKYKKTGVFELDEGKNFIRVMENHKEKERRNRYIAIGSIILSMAMIIIFASISEAMVHISVVLLLCSIGYLIVYLVTDLPKSYFFNNIKEAGRESYAEDINLDIPLFDITDIYAGEKAFYARKDDLLIAYEDVIWVYNDSSERGCLKICLKNGTKHDIRYQMDESKFLIEIIKEKSEDEILLFNTPKCQQKYDEIVKAYRKEKLNKK